jgi:hypothetical protein
MSYTGNLTRADEQELDVAHPDYVPLAERRDRWRAAARAAQADDAPVTDNRAKFVRDLLDERAVPAEAAARLIARLAVKAVTNGEARGYINWLKSRPRTAPVADAQAAPAVPDGRYAVHNDDQSVNDIAFYEVENVTEGKWAGWTFVRQIVGPDERKLSQKQGRAILAKVTALGLRESLQLFGQNTEKCGVCNRNLTNKESREYGIGPDCRAKHGY